MPEAASYDLRMSACSEACESSVFVTSAQTFETSLVFELDPSRDGEAYIVHIDARNSSGEIIGRVLGTGIGGGWSGGFWFRVVQTP